MSRPTVQFADPAYAEGFYDAIAGEPLFPDADPDYSRGWRGAWRAKEILASMTPPPTLPCEEE